MYDYISTTASADYEDVHLSVTPQRELVEEGQKNQVVHFCDDGSEEVISFDTESIFYVILEWTNTSATDSGTIMDYYHATGKGNGVARSFYWDSPDGYSYTVRFASPPVRSRLPGTRMAVSSVRFKILGKAP